MVEARSDERGAVASDRRADRCPHCRGVVLLGSSSSIDELRGGFEAATAARSCRGFAVGRTIFLEPSRAWFAAAIGDDELIGRVRQSFEALIDAWATRRSGAARPRAREGQNS